MSIKGLKVAYDAEHDVLRLSNGQPGRHTNLISDDLAVDVAGPGQPVGIELLDASQWLGPVLPELLNRRRPEASAPPLPTPR